ncbi:MAG: BatD family protein [Planctomycetota bacterium]
MSRLISTRFTLATLLVLALCAAFASPGRSRPAAPRAPQAGEVRVTAALSSGVLKLGDRTSIVVVIESEGQIPEANPLGDLPEVDGLKLGPPSGPSRTRYEQRFGRRSTITVTDQWIIPVRPLRAGEFEIPPFRIRAGGKTYESRSLVLKAVEDMTGQELGLLEVSASSSTVVEGLPFSIEVRFGWDEGLRDVNFADLSLGFWNGLPGVIELDREFPAPGAKRIEGGVTINGGEGVVVEEMPAVELRGRRFRQLRLVRSFVPTRAGRIDFSETFLNFGRAEEGGSFFNRRLEKVKDYYVRAPRFYVEVEPLPEEGQPYDFTGAVGSIAAKASVDARDVDVGDSIKLTVEWSGSGNLEFFDAPDPARMEAFEGFRVYGRTEEKSFERRTTVYDLAPMSDEVGEIPPVPLRVYDSERGEYITIATEAIPIRVRPLATAVELDAEGDDDEGLARDLHDIDTRALGSGGTGRRAPGPRAVTAVVFGVPILWVLLRTWARRRGDPSAPLERRRRGARRKLARALGQAGTPEEELRALHAFLAERTREPDHAWVGRDLEQAERRNGTSGSAPGDLGELRTLLERLEAAVWTGRGERVGRDEVLAVADRLMGAGL